MKEIKGLLFDFDGTLLDTNELIIQTFEHVLQQHYPDQYTREKIMPFLGPPLHDTFDLIDPKMTEQLVNEYRAWNIDHHDRLAHEFEGVSEALLTLKEAGYKLAIVSTKKNHMIHKGIQLIEAGNIFDTVIGLDDVLHAKPNPEPILLALERLELDRTEALMIGDNYHDIVGGKNAGVRTAGVAWSIKGESFLQKYNPDIMLHHISDLLPILQGHEA